MYIVEYKRTLGSHSIEGSHRFQKASDALNWINGAFVCGNLELKKVYKQVEISLDQLAEEETD